MRKRYICFSAALLLLWRPGTAQQPAGSQIDSIYQSITALEPAQRVQQTNARFYQLYSTDFELARKLAAEALEISRSEGWKAEEASCLKNLGIVNYLQGNYEPALEYYQQALRLFEALNDAAGQCSVYNEMGVFFSKRGEPDRASEYLRQADQLCRSVGDSIGWSNALDNLGLVYLRTGDLAAAKDQFLNVVQLRRAVRDSIGLSYVFNNLAAVATEQGRIDEAVGFLQQSTHIRKKLKDRQGVAININNMGETYLFGGEPEKAIPYFEESLVQSRALQFVDLERHTMDMLAKANEQTGNYVAALHWLNRSNALKDSLFNLQRSAQIAEMQEKYEAEKRENELSRQELALRKRNAWLALAGLGIISLISILVLVLRQQKQQQAQLKREAVLRESLLKKENENQLQQERLRISRDLHDHMGAELSLIRAGIARQLFYPDKAVDTETLKQINANTQKAMEELRETIWAIKGEGDSVQSLAEKLQDFAGRFDGVRIEVDWEEGAAQLLLSPAQTLNLYRICQEAIHNSTKYAPGAALRLRFFSETGHLRIVVADDGPGFSPNGEGHGDGMGNMQQRAEEIHAAFSLSSGKNGTVIEICMPLTASETRSY